MEIVRQRTPEEEGLRRKRDELAVVRATLAERELEIADLQAEIKSFEGRYLRQVGALYESWTTGMPALPSLMLHWSVPPVLATAPNEPASVRTIPTRLLIGKRPRRQASNHRQT